MLPLKSASKEMMPDGRGRPGGRAQVQTPNPDERCPKNLPMERTDQAEGRAILRVNVRGLRRCEDADVATVKAKYLSRN